MLLHIKNPVMLKTSKWSIWSNTIRCIKRRNRAKITKWSYTFMETYYRKGWGIL